MRYYYNGQQIRAMDAEGIIDEKFTMNVYERWLNENFDPVYILRHLYDAGTALRTIDPICFEDSYYAEKDALMEELEFNGYCAVEGLTAEDDDSKEVSA